MIGAIVPAAGLSSRMGGPVPKPLLPWAGHTVLEEVVTTILRAGVEEVVIVTGHRRETVEFLMAAHPVRCRFNPDYGTASMLSSIQLGLRTLSPACQGALLALADQPQIELVVVLAVLEAFASTGGQVLVVPSYQMRRGHPVILPRRLWPEVWALGPDETLRTIVLRHAQEIRYVPVETPSILVDLDTPEEYRAALEEGQSRGWKA